MKRSNDRWTWDDPSFDQWRAAVDRRLEKIYAITIDDAGIDNDYLTPHWEVKQAPNEFVEWFGIKYDLDPKSAFGV